MAPTPAPNPTLTPEQLEHQRAEMVSLLKQAGQHRAESAGLPTSRMRMDARRDSNVEIRVLVAEAHEQLGMSKPQIAAALGFASRQALHNIVTGETAV